jgi:hypothetical protein
MNSRYQLIQELVVVVVAQALHSMKRGIKNGGSRFQSLKIMEKNREMLTSPTEMNKPIALAGTQSLRISYSGTRQY